MPDFHEPWGAAEALNKMEQYYFRKARNGSCPTKQEEEKEEVKKERPSRKPLPSSYRRATAGKHPSQSSQNANRRSNQESGKKPSLDIWKDLPPIPLSPPTLAPVPRGMTLTPDGLRVISRDTDGKFNLDSIAVVPNEPTPPRSKYWEGRRSSWTSTLSKKFKRRGSSNSSQGRDENEKMAEDEREQRFAKEKDKLNREAAQQLRANLKQRRGEKATALMHKVVDPFRKPRRSITNDSSMDFADAAPVEDMEPCMRCKKPTLGCLKYGLCHECACYLRKRD